MTSFQDVQTASGKIGYDTSSGHHHEKNNKNRYKNILPSIFHLNMLLTMF